MAIELLPATSEEEKHLLYLAKLDETCRDAALAIETHAKRMKAQYDKHFSSSDVAGSNSIAIWSDGISHSMGNTASKP